MKIQFSFSPEEREALSENNIARKLEKNEKNEQVTIQKKNFKVKLT